MRAVLDTHILVPFVQGVVAPWAHELEDATLVVSPIVAAELGCLARLGRVRFSEPVDRWFERAVAALGAELAPMPAALLARSQAFTWDHRDPADRVLLQTVREMPGAVLFTKDRAILELAAVEGLPVRDCR